MDLWLFLHDSFLSRLHSGSSMGVVQHLELSLKRFYLVTAIQCERRDKVTEFFETNAKMLRGSAEWADWFSMPFLKDPAIEPAFRPYFTKEWASRLVVSVHNLLASVFQEMPLPALMTHHLHAIRSRKLESSIAQLEAAKELLSARLRLTLQGEEGLSDQTGAAAGGLAGDQGNCGGGGVGGSLLARGAVQQPLSGSGSVASVGSDSWEKGCSAGAGKQSTRGLGGDASEAVGVKVVGSRAYSGHSKAVSSCLFSGDGESVASASDDGTVRLVFFGTQRISSNDLATVCCMVTHEVPTTR